MNVYFTDTLTLKKTTFDLWGEPTVTTSTIKGRIIFKTRMVLNLQGEQVVSSARVLLDKDSGVSHSDKLYFDGRDHPILSIDKKKDFSERHIEVSVA